MYDSFSQFESLIFDEADYMINGAIKVSNNPPYYGSRVTNFEIPLEDIVVNGTLADFHPSSLLLPQI